MIYGISKNAAHKFKDEAGAAKFGNGWKFFSNAAELEASDVPTKDILNAYNKLAGKSIKKFSSRGDGCKQLLNSLATSPMMERPGADKAAPENKNKGPAPENKKAPKADKPKKAAKPKKEATGEGAGRKSNNTGKTFKLHPKHLGVNPRRKDTHGRKSLQIIIDGGDKGVTYEDFLAKGGRAKDLNWDIAKGNVEEVTK